MMGMTTSVRGILVILACILALALCGCEGSDARKSVAGTVEDLFGQKVIDQGEKMKKDIDRAVKKEAQRLLEMDEQSAGGSSKRPQEVGGED